MRKKGLLLFVVMLFGVGLYAQQQVQNSLYYFNPLNYNPAYAGSRDMLTLGAVHRIQWTGIEGAPQTTFLTVHSPIGDSHLSVGGNLVYDEIGVSKTTRAYLDVSYYVQLNDRGHRLAFGLNGGVNMFDVALSELKTNNGSLIDPLQKDISNEMKGNFGAGIYYYGEKHYIGFSALNMLEHSVIDNDEYKMLEQKRHFYLSAGYVFDVNSALKIKPSALVKAVAGAPLELDAEVAGLLYDKLWIGVGYRHDEAIRGYLVANVTPEFRVGYNYDYVFNELGKYTGGTHEFMLSYDFGFNDYRFKSPRYF